MILKAGAEYNPLQSPQKETVGGCDMLRDESSDHQEKLRHKKSGLREQRLILKKLF